MKKLDVVIKRFEAPDEIQAFEKGSFARVTIGGTTIGRARYEPGWKWSQHVGPLAGTRSCVVEHVGLVVSGRAAVQMDDGRELVLTPGDLFHVPPGHDSWVVGDEPYVSIHLLGAEQYATVHTPTPSSPGKQRRAGAASRARARRVRQRRGR